MAGGAVNSTYSLTHCSLRTTRCLEKCH